MQLLVNFVDVTAADLDGGSTNPFVVPLESSAETVVDLKRRLITLEAAQKKNCALEAIQISYNGQFLSDITPLCEIDKTDDVTVYAIIGSCWVMDDASSSTRKKTVNDFDIMRVFNGLRMCLSDRQKRRRLHATLLRREGTKNLLSSIPLLAEDTQAVALLKCPLLLYRMAAVPEECRKLITQHPVLGEALLFVLTQVTNVNDDSTTSPLFADPVVALVSGLGLDDDDDGPSGMEGIMPMRQAAPDRRGNQPTARGTQQRQQRVNPQNILARPPAPAQQNAISPQMLTSALSAVLVGLQQQQQNPSSAAVAPPRQPEVPPPPPPPPRFQNELAMLRSMGVTNDAVAMAALEATNGNIEAALEIIFSSME